MEDKLFVYGTLMSGFNNSFSATLHKAVKKTVPAKIKGNLYVVTDWEFHYPVADFRPDTEQYIYGELLYFNHSADLEQLFFQLDQYEGVDMTQPEKGEYVRKKIPVMHDTKTVFAFAYINNKYPINLAAVPHGNFRKYTEEM